MGSVRLFKHHVHTVFVWLAALEGLAFMFSVYLGAHMRFVGVPEAVTEFIGPIFPRAATFGVAMLVSMAAMGLYQQRLREGLSGILIRTMGAFLLMSLVISVVFYLFPTLFLGRGALGLSLLVSFLFVILIRSVFNRVVDHRRLKCNVLVLGAGSRAKSLLQGLRRKSDRRGVHFVGFVHVAEEKDRVSEDLVIHLEVSLCDYAVANDVAEILVAVDDRRCGLPINDLLDCKLRGIDVVDVAGFFERELGKIMLEFVTPGWMVFSDGFGRGPLRAVTKRGFDLMASFLLLMCAWPIMLLVVLAIWLEDGLGAPVIYRQKRVGLSGRVFDVLKFRSMKIDAEKSGEAVWAKKNDGRITRVGRFIRNYRIDELPQVLNVMAGDMGFVGPRPERPVFVEKLEKLIPHYSARHQIKPGIAGWAQLCYPYGATDKDAREKLQFDLYYVKNNSLFLDVLILVQTLEVVLFGKGVR